MDYDKIKVKRVTLPSYADVAGPAGINVTNEMSRVCKITDLCILTDCYKSPTFSCWYFLSTMDNRNEKIYSVNDRGKIGTTNNLNKRSGGVRPLITVNNFDYILKHAKKEHGKFEIEYGEYPQYVVSEELAKELDSKFEEHTLVETGKVYTTDSRNWDDLDKPFCPISHKEYMYNDKKYVRVVSIARDSFINGELVSFVSSTNGTILHLGNYYWLEVSPIRWLVDPIRHTLISEKLLLAGLRACSKYDGQFNSDFSTTEMYMFLNKYFINEIIPSKMVEYEENLNETMNESAIQTTIDAKTDDIYAYLKEYHDIAGIKNRVEALKQEYRADINRAFDYREKGGLVLVDDSVDEDVLFKRLIANLETIKQELTNTDDRRKEYIVMYDYIEKALKALDEDGKGKTSKDNYVSDIYIIKEVIFPYFKDDKRKEQLRKLLTFLKQEIVDFLRDGKENEISKIKTITEFEMLYNEKMLLYLTKVMADIENAEALAKIKKEFINNMNDNINKSRIEYVSVYLKEIQEMLAKINKHGNEEEKANALKSYHSLNDFVNTEEATLKIRKVFMELYGIVYQIDSRGKMKAQRQRYDILDGNANAMSNNR